MNRHFLYPSRNTYFPLHNLPMKGFPTGTIDKDYPKTKGGRNFEIGEPSVRRVMARLRPARSVITSLHTVCRKDSLDLTEDDR